MARWLAESQRDGPCIFVSPSTTFKRFPDLPRQPCTVIKKAKVPACALPGHVWGSSMFLCLLHKDVIHGLGLGL